VSRVYWHSPSGEAELYGSERAWLEHVARGPATVAWNLTDSADDLAKSQQILAMVPEVPDGEYGSNYLHTGLQEAEAEHNANRAALKADKPPFLHSRLRFDAQRQHLQSLRMRLRNLELVVGPHRLHSSNVELNTALKVGSDPIKLAAKIHGWCEAHCYIEGEDRGWAADIIDEGLAVGVYRKGMWYVSRPHDPVSEGPRHEQPDAQFHSQGWEDVLTHLRSRDDEPVVLSYSVCDQFPNAETALDYLPPWPEGVPERYDALPKKDQIKRDRLREKWYDLPSEQQWELGMAGLRTNKPWARLSPKTLGTIFFCEPVTVYDLLAPDRDERVAACFAKEQENPDP
jgi:hypothetical protein